MCVIACDIRLILPTLGNGFFRVSVTEFFFGVSGGIFFEVSGGIFQL